MLAGLDTLDASALKIRVVQLVSEIKNRTKWEAMRLLDALKTIEAETNAKNMEMFKNQERLHQEILGRELELKEKEMNVKLQKEVEVARGKCMSEMDNLVEELQSELLVMYKVFYIFR